mmetsp:Transcript_73529/g.153419  ORF Transcript_73529/g.153419 Transcript_73529/m.153419 type:complete len:273 (-) Transcript_73529:1398-2216(-)
MRTRKGTTRRTGRRSEARSRGTKIRTGIATGIEAIVGTAKAAAADDVARADGEAAAGTTVAVPSDGTATGIGTGTETEIGVEAAVEEGAAEVRDEAEIEGAGIVEGIETEMAAGAATEGAAKGSEAKSVEAGARRRAGDEAPQSAPSRVPSPPKILLPLPTVPLRPLQPMVPRRALPVLWLLLQQRSQPMLLPRLLLLGRLLPKAVARGRGRSGTLMHLETRQTNQGECRTGSRTLSVPLGHREDLAPRRLHLVCTPRSSRSLSWKGYKSEH